MALPKEQPKKAKQQKSWEDQLFLTRLRRHMKWVFVLLAVVFAIGFVVFGVGTGGGGGALGDVLHNLFGGNKTSAPTLASAQQKVADHPNDPSALHDLAVAQQNNKDYTAAAKTLEKYVTLRPTDADALRLLAANYSGAALRETSLASQLSTSGLATGYASNACQFQGSTGFLGAVCENPIDQASRSAYQAKSYEATNRATGFYAKEAGAYARLAKVTPADPLAYELWGSAAEKGRKNDEAITAYKAFLERFPDDPAAATVRKHLASLTVVGGAKVG